jgi:hypothetical protein
MNSGLVGPDATWPGVLLLEIPEQGLVVGEMRSMAGLSEGDKRELACRLLPARIRTSKADRFAWVMPVYNDTDPPGEHLAVVLAEPGHREALTVEVIRGGLRPKLGEWSNPSRRVEGLFVEPLCWALLAKQRPKRRQRSLTRSGPARRATQPARNRNQERAHLERKAAGRPLVPNCHDCGAQIGEPHRPGCDVEPCSVCWQQRLLCDCPGHDPLAVVWEGEWPGASACRALGWWAVRTPDGWRPCPPGTPGAIEDANRLAYYRETGQDLLYDDLEVGTVTSSDPQVFDPLPTRPTEASWPAADDQGETEPLDAR